MRRVTIVSGLLFVRVVTIDDMYRPTSEPFSRDRPFTFLGVSAIIINKHLLFRFHMKEDLQRKILTRLRLTCEEHGGQRKLCREDSAVSAWSDLTSAE